MSGSFLDTTVLMDLSQSRPSAKSKSQKFVDSHQPSEVAFYASRELLTGPVRYICDTHNILLASQNHAEAFVGISKRFAMKPRARDAATQVLAESLKEVFGDDRAGTGADFKREGLQAIKIKAAQLWSRASRPTRVSNVQPLACFNSGEISIGTAGELRGPNNSFNCVEKERCAAAGYLHEDQVSLSKLIDALHPRNLDDTAKNKQENKSRRKTLKTLQDHGPKGFDKRRCRALGDAYFAAMCPGGSVIATTNLSDFEPLCKALGKTAEKP